MNINFSGKRALVTGAGRGIGRDIVKKLVACNAEVIAVSLTEKNLATLKEEIPNVRTIAVDLSNWNATTAALENIGPVDLLVNNAATATCQPFGEITSEVFDHIFSVNVKAVINVSQIVSKGMKERGTGGAIVNISSQAGLVGLKDHSVYGASKAAVDMLTKVMALELGPHKIRVNSVNPTVCKTEMSMVGWSDPEKAAAMISRIPLGQFCEIEHVVDVVIFLLSSQAAMVSGIQMPVDGGFVAS